MSGSIPGDAKRAYMRQLALYALAAEGRAITAADLAEHMGTVAMADGHSKRLWRSIDSYAAHGALKALEHQGLIRKDGEERNTRKGRSEPLWSVTESGKAVAFMPREPDEEESAVLSVSTAAPPASAPRSADTQPGKWSSYSHGQLAALLDYLDAQAGEVSRALRIAEVLRGQDG